MTIGDINKWISGETDVFFDTHQMPPSVTADSNPGAGGGSTARPSIPKFAHPAITAVVGALASVALVTLVIWMRQPVETFPVAEAKLTPSDGGATSTRASAVEDAIWSTPVKPPTEIIPTLTTPPLNQPTTMLSDAQVAAFLSEVSIWYDRRKAAPPPERKTSPPRWASRRH
jgi:hypothetical protein